MLNLKKRKNGFTLIELLVVIAIVSLMSSIVFASLNSARGKSRDAKRKAELRQIQIALEFYYDSHGGYPGSACVPPNTPTTWDIPRSLAAEPKMTQLLSTMPRDPRTPNSTSYNEQYLYFSSVPTCTGNNASAQNYALYATLEDQTSNNRYGGANDNTVLSNLNMNGTPRPNWTLGTY